MRKITPVLLFFFLLVSVGTAEAQDYCRTILNQATAAFAEGEGNIDEALRHLLDSEECDYQDVLQEERQVLLRRIITAIQSQKETAEQATLLARAEALRADQERDRAVQAQELAEQRARLAEASRLAYLSDIERENGQIDDALGLAYTAYQLLDGVPIPAVKEAFGNAVHRKYGVSIATDATITQFGFLAGGELFYLVTRDNQVGLYDDQGERQATLSGHTDHILAAIPAPSGRHLLTVSKDRTAKLWDTTGQLVHNFTGHQDAVTTGTFAPDETKVMTATRGGEVKIWDVATGVPVATAQYADFPILSAGMGSAAFWVASSRRVQLLAWNGTELGQIDHAGEVIYSVAFSPAADYLLTTSADGSAKLWQPDGTAVQTLDGHSRRSVLGGAFSTAGNQVLTYGLDGTASTWQPDGTRLRTLKAPADRVLRGSFAPDGNWLLTAHSDHALDLWNAADGTLNAELTLHRGQILTAAFAPDSKYVLSSAGGDDNTVKLWDITGDLTANLSPGSAPRAVFSPDGNQVLTASPDGRAVLFPRSDFVLERIATGGISIPQIKLETQKKYNLGGS